MIRAPTGKENIMIRAGPGRVLFYCKNQQEADR